ncbi:MAG: fumarylacetoacetate hydrolase family protein [candidate division Zixibacteria bacterium]|nr:fumarylacetoacetate hydrolase family protein [candidate division Zixibacteria bacterium]
MVKNKLNCARIFCIGRNYAEHIQELSNTVPEKPVVFIKPASCLVKPGEKIHFPKHGKELHHEVEIVVKIGSEGRVLREEEALSFVSAVTVGLDLTLRDVQADLKKKGLPWEIAKAFEQSAPIGSFVPYNKSIDLNNISFGCKVNGIEKQRGNSRDMIFSISRLLVELSKIWMLRPGDLLFTGTPSGVGPLKVGDSIEIKSNLTGSFSWSIVE